MNPPSPPAPWDPKRIVETGYDAISERYTAWAASVREDERARYTRVVEDSVPRGGAILELGCGAGVPTTARLAQRFSVTGVDLSARQLDAARVNVPNARFIHADMTELAFPPATFDAVVAFYSITHVPRQQHAPLFARIHTWLRPGGLFVACLGHGESDMVEDGWLGVPMFFSHYDAPTNVRLVTAAGLAIVSARSETEDEFGSPSTFLWVVAQKPTSP